MRELKFRTWIGNCFHYWGFIREGSQLYFQGIATINESMSYKLEHSQQFTGLFDKQGKEIWEGDIVRGMVTGDYPALIECDAPNGGYNIRDKNGEYIVIDSNIRIEVIGNIYENLGLITPLH